jgi:hypothetical protein
MMESSQTDFANFAVGFLKKETGGLAKNESGVVRPTGVVRSMKKNPNGNVALFSDECRDHRSLFLHIFDAFFPQH